MTADPLTTNDVTFAGQLYPYQVEAVTFLRRTRRALLALAPGLGKTLTTLGYIAGLYASGHLTAGSDLTSDRVLIIVPPSLIGQWLAAVLRFLPAVTVHATVAGGKPPARPVDVEIIASTLVGRRDFEFTYGLVVVDEIGAVFTAGGATFLAAQGVGDIARRFVGLTGTPYPGPLELWHLLRLVTVPGLPSFERWQRQFVRWTEGIDTYGRPIRSAAGLLPGAAEKIGEIMRRSTYYRTAEQVGLHLPTVKVIDKPVPLTGAQARASAASAPGVQRDQTEIVHDGESALTRVAVDVVRGLQDERVLMWCGLRGGTALILDGLRAAGIPAVTIDGTVTQRTRKTRLDAFTAGAVRVLVGTNAIDTGTDGLQIASALVDVGTTWNPIREEQRLGRLRRLGSRHETITHVRVLPATAYAEYKARRLDEKGEDVAAIIAALSQDVAGVPVPDGAGGEPDAFVQDWS